MNDIIKTDRESPVCFTVLYDLFHQVPALTAKHLRQTQYRFRLCFVDIFLTLFILLDRSKRNA